MMKTLLIVRYCHLRAVRADISESCLGLWVAKLVSVGTVGGRTLVDWVLASLVGNHYHHNITILVNLVSYLEDSRCLMPQIGGVPCETVNFLWKDSCVRALSPIPAWEVLSRCCSCCGPRALARSGMSQNLRAPVMSSYLHSCLLLCCPYLTISHL